MTTIPLLFRMFAEHCGTTPVRVRAVGSDGGGPNTQGTPELALASRARGSRDPGRRRRSRPTLTTPRESAPRRTGRATYRTKFQSHYFHHYNVDKATMAEPAAGTTQGTKAPLSEVRVESVRAPKVGDLIAGIARQEGALVRRVVAIRIAGR